MTAHTLLTDGRKRLYDELTRLERDAQMLLKRKSEVEAAHETVISLEHLDTLSDETRTQMVDAIANEVLAS